MAGGAAPRDRRIDRPRGRVAQPARHEPARHEPRRRRGAAPEPRRLRACRTSSTRRWLGPGSRRSGRAVTIDVSVTTCRRSSSTRSSWARCSRTPSTMRPSTAGPMPRSAYRPHLIATDRRSRVTDRGWRTRRAGRDPATALREVLPRPPQGRGLAARHGDRSRGRPRARRGDGRSRRGPSQRARWAGGRVRRADRGTRAPPTSRRA